MGKEIKLQTNTNSEGNTIFHIAERFLDEHYFLRYNTIKKEVEWKPKLSDKKWDVVNENSLFIHLQKSNIKIGFNNLISILRSEFVPKHDPLKSYFTNLPAYKSDNEKDYIKELCNHIEATQPEQFYQQFKKWLVRVVKCGLDDGFFNKQAFIFVQSKQNSGKSTLCRWLTPPLLKDYLAEDLTTDKDSRILLTKNLMINLDELSSLHRKEINSLKALFSKNQINERLPFDRKNSVLSRTCSFLGSTNLSEFLTDETGSVRWLCFEIKSINWGYKKAIDINDVWRQAYSLYLDSEYNANMTAGDIQENEVRNQQFQMQTLEQEMIFKFFKQPENGEFSEFYTASDVVNLIHTWSTIRVNKMMTGRAIKSLGYERIKDKSRYGYQMIFLQPRTVSNE